MYHVSKESGCFRCARVETAVSRWMLLPSNVHEICRCLRNETTRLSAYREPSLPKVCASLQTHAMRRVQPVGTISITQIEITDAIHVRSAIYGDITDGQVER